MTVSQIASQMLEWLTVGVAFVLLTSLFIIYSSIRFLIKISKYDYKQKVGTFGKHTT